MRGLAVVVALAALVPFASTLGHGLVWDDPALVELVERAYQRGGLVGVATVEFTLDPREPTGYYRPVVLLSLWADARIGAGSAAVYHATNVLLHVACALLLAAVTAQLLRSAWAGAAAGVLFATHPVHVESVAFVAGRTDLWAGLFVLAATLAWARGRGAAGARLAGYTAASGAAVALGGLSKEMAVALPAVLGAVEALAAPAGETRTRWRRLVPWLGAWGLGVGLALGARAASGITLPAGTPAPVTAALAHDPLLLPQVVTRALALLAVPWPLNAYWTREQLAWSAGTLAAAALGAAIPVAAARWAGRRTAAAGTWWVVAFLLPASGLVTHGSAPFAERFLYVPSAGFCVVAGALVSAAGARRPARAPVVIALAVVAALLAAGSAVRAGIWKDEVSLFESATRTSPRSAALWDDLGQAYDAASRLDDAARAYGEALRLDPRRAGAWNGLGVVLGRTGKLADADRALREAIRLDPRMPHPRFNLALLCLSTGDRACTEEQLRALQALDPAAAARAARAMRQAR